jgi:hypothetical protein
VTAIGVGRPCPPFTLGVDGLAHFTRDQLVDFHGRGARVVGAYLENLTPEYRDLILSCEMGIAPYTMASTGPVNNATGASRGATAVRQAVALGVPLGCHVLIDLEGVVGTECGDHVNAFDAALSSGGYSSMLYVGAPQPLTAQQLEALRPARYMRSCSFGVPEPSRGWCCLQLRPGDVTDATGARVDWLVVEQDGHGCTPTWWFPG